MLLHASKLNREAAFKSDLNFGNDGIFQKPT